MAWAYRTAQLSAAIASVGVAAWTLPAVAETPGEIPKPWTYEGSKRLQEQQQQQSQPFQQPQAPGGTPSVPNAGAAPGAAAFDAARRTWLSRPALPPDRNPLLGKWTRPASTRPNSKDPFGQLQALAKGGMCEVLFGGGVFEFRPDRLVGMDERTREQELDRVEYRGDAKHVVVLPKTTIKLIEFDFDGPDRINWTGQNCVLVRVASASSAAAPSMKPVTAAPASAAAAPSGAGGILMLSVSAISPGDKVAGRKFWILKTDPQLALIKGGLASSPYGSVLQNWIRACQKKEQACATGMQALQPYSVGFLAADASGHAQTPRLPEGRYWVLSDAKIDNRHVMWHQPVDVKGTEALLTLDRSNVISVD